MIDGLVSAELSSSDIVGSVPSTYAPNTAVHSLAVDIESNKSYSCKIVDRAVSVNLDGDSPTALCISIQYFAKIAV